MEFIVPNNADVAKILILIYSIGVDYKIFVLNAKKIIEEIIKTSVNIVFVNMDKLDYYFFMIDEYW